MTKWPLQSECDSFYGNPRGSGGDFSHQWYAKNVIEITPPYQMKFGHVEMHSLRIHRNCAESALRILHNSWDKIGRNQARADALGMSAFSGSFNYRPIRNGHRLSMHSYACAWDWDAPNNMMGDATPKFGFDHPFVVAHLEEGWIWGADWDGDHLILDSHPIDGMHFQAARIR